jgi:hypothetical protein
MRWIALSLICRLGSIVVAQDDANLAKRYGIEANLVFYPQKEPRETVLSIVKAIEKERLDYMLAHLADPRFVDEAVADYKKAVPTGSDSAKQVLAFDRLVKETSQYFLEDPTLLKELRKFAKDGEWEADEEKATGTLKTVQGRKVFLRKQAGRWFLENRQQ